ncbi:MAG: hypothetical protein RR927_04490 [Victivallaceae bacterium]
MALVEFLYLGRRVRRCLRSTDRRWKNEQMAQKNRQFNALVAQFKALQREMVRDGEGLEEEHRKFIEAFVLISGDTPPTAPVTTE